jgi:hypothetical protein
MFDYFDLVDPGNILYKSGSNVLICSVCYLTVSVLLFSGLGTDHVIRLHNV